MSPFQTPAQTIQAWVDDREKHAIIGCQDWDELHSRGVRAPCDACARPVSIWPAALRKATSSERVHILCRHSCVPLLIRLSPGLPFGSLLRSNKLPQDLADWT